LRGVWLGIACEGRLSDTALDRVLSALHGLEHGLRERSRAALRLFSEAAGPGESSTWFDPKWAAEKRTASKDLYGALADFQAGRINADTLADRWQTTIDKATRAAYESGLRRSGAVMDRGGDLFLKRSREAEGSFARNFVNDLANDNVRYPGGPGARLGLYVKSLDSWKTQGWIDGDPDPRYEYDWVLGSLEPCDDCTLLASMGPYTDTSLPTVPGTDTRCLSNCRCHLIRREVPVPKERAAETRAVDSEGMPVETLLEPEPPRGLGRPSDDQWMSIADLQYQVNYWRREMDIATTEEGFLAAMSERKAANEALIGYTTENGVYAVPTLSVDDILTGEDIMPVHVEEMMADSLDGLTLGRLSKREINALMADFMAGIDEWLAGI
jgi:hypothetical protein